MCSRRTLTVPAAPKQRGSIDNANDDLIVSEGDVFISSIGVRCVFWKNVYLETRLSLPPGTQCRLPLSGKIFEINRRK